MPKSFTRFANESEEGGSKRRRDDDDDGEDGDESSYQPKRPEPRGPTERSKEFASSRCGLLVVVFLSHHD